MTEEQNKLVEWHGLRLGYPTKLLIISIAFTTGRVCRSRLAIYEGKLYELYQRGKLRGRECFVLAILWGFFFSQNMYKGVNQIVIMEENQFEKGLN